MVAAATISVFEHRRSDHLVEVIVFALGWRDNIQQCGADLLSLEACLDQVRHLGLLKAEE